MSAVFEAVGFAVWSYKTWGRKVLVDLHLLPPKQRRR